MVQIVFEVSESVDGGFEASALGHRIHTQGDTWDDLKLMVQDAVRCHFAEAERPTLINLLMTRELETAEGPQWRGPGSKIECSGL